MPVGVPELALIISIAAVLGLIATLLRQPIILAYLGAGALIGALGLFQGDQAIFEIFSNLGVMFLLFLIGLEINYMSLRLVGKASLLVGLGQIAFTFAGGWFLAALLGFSVLTGAYIAIALTFSSTIIVVKLLSEKKELSSLYGKISVGFLLVQDFVAILLLVLLAGIDTGAGADAATVLLTLLKGVALFAFMLWLGRRIVPFVLDRIARSIELLFLMSLAWVFVVAWVVSELGFSIAIGGFLAGIALANSSEHLQIASRVKPLRDFFIVIFFVLLGSSVAAFDLSGLALPIIIFSLFVLIGNPLIVLAIMGLMGYHRRTSFMAGVTVAQISEFSLIVAALGLQVGHISEQTVSLITAVGVITIGLSSYLILYAEHLYRWLRPALALFEVAKPRTDSLPASAARKRMVLFGAHRYGQSLLRQLPKRDVLVVDFDPDVVRSLRRAGYTTMFGDLADPELFEGIDFSRTAIVISTSPEVTSTLAFLEARRTWRRRGQAMIVIARAEGDREAHLLYAAGADYVLMPHLTSGQMLGTLLHERAIGPQIKRLRSHDLAVLARNRGNG
ncbi:MAG: cation:proton antiporter [Candidatus Kerfeldbacteria bacterium]|nr:cation:proton antiporter [Candidatus Kerfeldbacteria bacterium]